ncbi:MAG: TonB-dependent receptor, plug [Verrucomicrobiales bacterium]|nr:TonB-dependent receptor, plug [Verrucomicrobiales bacterium]
MPAFAAEDAPQIPEKNLGDLSIEQLMNESVTSVSRKETKLNQAPAAITVISQEDIRRSGATSIAEALRMAPGLDVAQVDQNKWAISSRGFNGLYANKLLVLMDGRSVYSPLFGGVNWSSQDTVLDDIERIEVIRGPGAALWGANAVNGVINIITKSAKETQGTLISAGAGSEQRGSGEIRYGGKINDQAFYRVYAKYFNFDDSMGATSSDAWDMFRTGFRTDWTPADQNTLTLQGDYYQGRTSGYFPNNQLDLSQTILEKMDLTGANLLGRWTHVFSATSGLEIQTYFDHVDRRSPYTVEAIDTFDIDGQHRFEVGVRNEVVWGLGYRLIADHDLSSGFATFEPNSANRQIMSTFLQDEIKIVPDHLTLTLGSKLEHNDYSGFEVEPNARLSFTPTERQTVWSSVARAVKTPSRFEQDIRFALGSSPGGGGLPPTELTLFGNPEIKSERLTAYELGYRLQPKPSLSFDVAAFYNVYDDLLGGAVGTPEFISGPPQPHVSVPVLFQNAIRGETHGVEISANWKATEYWKIGAGYTWLRMHLDLPDDSRVTPSTAAGDSPQNQFNVHSYLDLPYHLQLDSAVYYVDALPNQKVESYLRWDLRLGWNPTRNLEFTLGVQNLLDSHHLEFGTSTAAQSAPVGRNVYGKLTWRF